MRKSQLDQCLRLYRQGVAAYGELAEKLKAARVAARRFPQLGETRRQLSEAEGDLDRIGGSLSVLPELAEELREEMRIQAVMRDLAAKEGFVFRLNAWRRTGGDLLDDDLDET